MKEYVDMIQEAMRSSTLGFSGRTQETHRQHSSTEDAVAQDAEVCIADVIEKTIPKPRLISTSELPLKLPICKTWGDIACCCCLTLFLVAGAIVIGVWYVVSVS